MFFRIVGFIVTICLGVYAPFWVFSVVALGYLIKFQGYALLIFAVLFDSFFMDAGAYQYPRYTLIVIFGMIIGLYIRKRTAI